jgi:hypothetical protein
LKILFFILLVLIGTLTVTSAYSATAFFANGGLTKNGIEWCEENYQLYQFMDVDFFKHYKHSIESRICVSLYQDHLWTYSGDDKYEKLVEQSRIYMELEINESSDEADSGIIDIEPASIEEIPQEIIQQQKELDERPLQQTKLVCGIRTVEKDGQCIPESNIEDTLANDIVINEGGGGCLIATAAFGSELSPRVQQLRELRDNKLLQTESGTSFINNFNKVYYSFSPFIADYERENTVFREMVEIAITPMIYSLSILNHVEIDSDQKVLGYGISLIVLNVGMYVGIPVIAIMRISK